jgi:hypothetical protein
MQPVPRRGWLFLFGSLAMVAVVAVGFGPTLYLRPMLGRVDIVTGSRSLPTHLLIHGLALTAWFSLLAVQALLVKTGRAYVHRRLGWIALAVVPAVVITSAVTLQRVLPRFLEAPFAADPARRAVVFQRVTQVIVSDSFTLVVFVSFVACALYLRAKTATHSRLMFLASAKLIGPALATNRPIGVLVTPLLPQGLLPSTVFLALCIAGLVWYDLATRRRLERATIWGTAAIVAALVLTYADSGHAGPAFRSKPGHHSGSCRAGVTRWRDYRREARFRQRDFVFGALSVAAEPRRLRIDSPLRTSL